MAQKPTVIFVTSSSEGSDDVHSYFVKAMTFYLQRYCDCDVKTCDYSWDVAEQQFSLKKMVTSGTILCFIVRQDRYDNDYKRTVDIIQKNISKATPVLLQRCMIAEEEIVTEQYWENVSVWKDDGGMIKYVDQLRAAWKMSEMPLDYFDIRTQEELTFLCSRLVKAYEANLDDNSEECALGPIDHNHRIFAEALRLRLLPSERLKDEFDDVVGSKPQPTSFSSTNSEVYDQELDRVLQMDPAERKTFYHNLLWATGCVPAEGGGAHRLEVSRGKDNSGFAIDAVTLASTTSEGFGLHAHAKQILKMQLEVIQILKRQHKGSDEAILDDRGWHIVSGLIIPSVKGFKTPIVILYHYPQEEETELFKRVVKHIMQERKFIPVNGNGDPFTL